MTRECHDLVLKRTQRGVIPSEINRSLLRREEPYISLCLPGSVIFLIWFLGDLLFFLLVTLRFLFKLRQVMKANGNK